MQNNGLLNCTVVIDERSAMLLLLLMLAVVDVLMVRVIHEPPRIFPPLGEIEDGTNAGNTWKSKGLLVTPALEDTTN